MAVFNGTAGPDNLVGGAENDVLNGLAGADTLDGGLGADTMLGGLGDDTYSVDNVGDSVTENAAEGTDLVNTSVSYTLGANVENLTGIGSAGLTLTGNSLLNAINGTTGGDAIDGGIDAEIDQLSGGLGNDTYLIRNAPGVEDVITEVGNAGNDTVSVVASVGRAAYTLQAGVVVENLIASDATSTVALNLVGNTTAQNIAGNNGVNVLTGGGGADTLTGFAGNDTYNVSTGTTVVVEADQGGNDTVNIQQVVALGDAAVSYTFAGAVETITVATTGAGAATVGVNVTGGATSQLITGNDAANALNGGGGTDTLNGGLGNDVYTVDSLDDTIIDADGADRVNAIGSYQLNVAGIEVLAADGTVLPTGTSPGVPQGNGTLDLGQLNTTVNAGGATTFYTGDTVTTQTIYGNTGNNILNGRTLTGAGPGAVVDTLVGGSGDDIYRVYEQGDVVVEDTTGGVDTIYTSATYSLVTNDTNARAAAIGAVNTGADFLGATAASQIENLIVADAVSTTAIDLTGNAFGQIIVGNYGANTITSGGVGSGQIDQLSGLRGNDVYNVSARTTTVNENVGEGTDTVNVDLGTAAGADTFFALINQSEVEFLNATGTGRIDLQGSSFAQVITGNIAANTITGGGGADTMVGGQSGDNYLVTSQSEQVVEANGVEVIGGVTQVDTVFTTVSYDLANSVNYIATAANAGTPSNVGAGIPGTPAVITTGQVGIEVLSTAVQAGTEAINLAGNSQAQTLIGNYGNNILNGDNNTVTAIGGADVQTGTAAGDTLVGLFGDDVYRVYSQNDVIQEQGGQGSDTAVFGSNAAIVGSLASDAANTYQLRAGNSIETLTVANQSRSVGYQLIGNAEAQTVLGSLANDVLWGGTGNDTLIGNGGIDTFGFNEAGAANADIITDFVAGDRIALANTAGTGFFDALSRVSGSQTTAFDANEFVVGTTAVGTNAQVVYDQTTGQIFYDTDGTGSAVAQLVATISAGTQLGFNDFSLVAAPPTTPV